MPRLNASCDSSAWTCRQSKMMRQMSCQLRSMLSMRTIRNEGPAIGGFIGKGTPMPTMTDEQIREQFGPPAWVLHAPNLPGLRFEIRPVSAGAPDNTITIAYRRKGERLTQCGAASFKDGVWKNGKGKPLDPDGLYWTHWVTGKKVDAA